MLLDRPQTAAEAGMDPAKHFGHPTEVPVAVDVRQLVGSHRLAVANEDPHPFPVRCSTHELARRFSQELERQAAEVRVILLDSV
jgi:hypothetical protein